MYLAKISVQDAGQSQERMGRGNVGIKRFLAYAGVMNITWQAYRMDVPVIPTAVFLSADGVTPSKIDSRANERKRNEILIVSSGSLVCEQRHSAC
jgi:hypothetical protein